MTITKERLLKIQHWRETYGADSNVMLPAEEAEELARIALASLEAEAVCVIDQSNLDYLKSGADADVWPASRKEMGDVLLYRTAPPAPVVPDEREAFNVWNNDTDCPLAGLNVKQAAWLAWLKRSGTIKSFEPATDEFEVWARSEGLIHDSYGLRTVNTSADVARKAWNACRAAMLQGADGKPELTVWYGSMPETNGKTNWTAMLHRKGQHPWEGITIDCSEYPDRVRYEADRMRHLIGELADEPDILAYDADAHSGYVNPGNSPVTQDCWCRTCRPVTMSDMRFVVCPECGNKRCPHANDHKNDCTGSNEPGQEGSAYPAAPQQEVNNV
ncbi:hypothetical protein [Salmonella enterica]|uniref:hypothetical protein n=1 Tax=Salmonella enterica TaxID=28901 RepID=UPI003F344DAF